MADSAGKLGQALGFLLLVGMLFWALSVGSYSADDPTWHAYQSVSSSPPHNLGGLVGATWADWSLQALGSTVWLLIGSGALAGWQLLRRRPRAVLAVVWRGGLLLGVASATAFLVYERDPLVAGVWAGGVLGQWLAKSLLAYLNPLGTYLVLAAGAGLALGIGVDYHRRVAALQGGLRWLKRQGKRLAFPLRYMWRQGKAVLVACRTGVSRLIKRRQARASRTTPPATPREKARDTRSPKPAVASPAAASPETSSVPVVVSLPTDAPPAAPSRRLSARTPVSSSLPPLDLLDPPSATAPGQSEAELMAQARLLEQKLRDFGVEGEVVQVLPGPVITMYEFAPAAGIKVSRIVNLQDDLALALSALSVRVVAPIPGKAVVGIEIPNKRRETVRLRDVLDCEAFRTSTAKLSLALGKDILGRPVIIDLALIPHLLIAGATGSGKSVGLNSMICSLLFRATPAEVKMIMIDPKMLELSVYDGIPHLLIPVVTHPKKAAVALRRTVEEMERRYQLLAARGVRSIAQYNDLIAQEAQQGTPPADGATPPAEPLPYLVVIIDELSDLMLVSSREVEDSLTRIAQMARAAGIHLIVATQRPSVDVLTGVIKANFPARISFQVSSKTDSRTILDTNGAEKLLGRGDMLFLAPGTSKPQRIHGAYVSEAEIHRLVQAWKAMAQPRYDEHFLESATGPEAAGEEEYDEKYDEAVALVTRTGQASISMLQRRLRVGYNRAARMIEIMEKEGIVGPADGVKPREVLVRKTYDED